MTDNQEDKTKQKKGNRTYVAELKGTVKANTGFRTPQQQADHLCTALQRFFE